MLDWLTFTFPYSGPDWGAQFLKRDFSTGLVEKARTIPGHHRRSNSAGLAILAFGGSCMISGNPIKFLTGQNIVGHDDLPRLINETISALIDDGILCECLLMRRAIASGSVSIQRVDVTFHYDLGSDDRCEAFLRALHDTAHVKHRGRGLFDMEMSSVLFGVKQGAGGKLKGSTYSSFKFYNKLREIQKFPPSCRSDMIDELTQFVTGHARAEARLMGRELKKTGHHLLSGWNQETARALHRAWLEKIKISENIKMKHADEIEIPRALASTYRLWQHGEDLRALLPKSTFYRQRALLLEHGIDIASPVRSSVPAVVDVPVINLLEAAPVDPSIGLALYERLAA